MAFFFETKFPIILIVKFFDFENFILKSVLDFYNFFEELN